MTDTSGCKVLVEAWGHHFAKQLRTYNSDNVLCFLNFAVKGDASQVSLTGEYAGESQRGSSVVLPVTSSAGIEAFAEVDVDGATEISIPWKPTSTQMSADGPCFASYLASVRNSSLVFGDGDLRPVAPGSSDVWLPEPVRVWVDGVWLTDIRDAEVLYTPCSVCKKKVSELGECPNSACAGGAAETRAVLTTVTLADATGCLYQVLIRTEEFLVFTGMQTVADLEACLTSEGHVSLPFRCRADVILGAQKATQHGNAQTLSPHVAAFEVLRVTPVLLAEWDTLQRPLPEYVFQVNEACNVHCVFDQKFLLVHVFAFSTLAPLP